MPIKITAGETVRLEADTYDTNSIPITDASGDCHAPITIVGESGGGVFTKIIFEGDTTVIDKNGDGSTLSKTFFSGGNGGYGGTTEFADKGVGIKIDYFI